MLGSADLAEFGRSFGLGGSEEGVGVLQPAAEGDLPDLVISPIATHFTLAVWQNLGHDDPRCARLKNLACEGLSLLPLTRKNEKEAKSLHGVLFSESERQRLCERGVER